VPRPVVLTDAHLLSNSVRVLDTYVWYPRAGRHWSHSVMTAHAALPTCGKLPHGMHYKLSLFMNTVCTIHCACGMHVLQCITCTCQPGACQPGAAPH
jgi:hypothetical protein